MKFLLSSVPPWFPDQPYLSVPLLTGILKDKGYEVVQKDINLSFYDCFTSKKELLYQYEQFLGNKKRAHIDKKFELLIDSKEYIIDQIQSYKDEIRTLEYYKNKKEIAEAFKQIDIALKVFGLNYTETILSLGDIDYSFNYLDASDAIDFSLRNNIFSYFFRKYELEDIVRLNIDVVGFSIITPKQLIPAISFSNIIKSVLPNVKIVLGGPYISRVGLVLMQEPRFNRLIDYVLSGYGEKSIIDFANALTNPSDTLFSVPGLIYKNSNEINHNENSDIENIYENIPCPDFDGLFALHYFSPVIQLPLEISKACYWNRCKFCELRNLKYAEKPVDVILNEIKQLIVKYGTNYFSFVSASPSPKLLLKIADQISENKLKIKWSTMIRAEKYINEDFAQKLYAGGLRLVMIGIESGSQKVLDLMDKGIDIKTSEKCLHVLFKTGIYVHAYFMFGFNGEDNSDIDKTISFINKNQSYFNSIAFSYYTELNVNFNKDNIGIYLDNNNNLSDLNNAIRKLKKDYSLPNTLNTQILFS